MVAVPTVLLPWHPGLGQSTRTVPGALGAQLSEIAARVRPDGILTGYFASAEDVAAAARFIDAARGDAPVLVDPVSADAGGPYVPEPVRDALFQTLIPRASVLTPNRAEAALFGLGSGAQAVVVTSAQEREGTLTSRLVAGGKACAFSHAKAASAPNGTGDLSAALILAGLVEGQTLADATHDALAATVAVVDASDGPDLALGAAQDALVAPPRGRVTRR